ncbi:MAG: DUF1285 domain-containing protein [Robiginitomaculum sp.]|nr:DUF1285 domain-containing protein [Robiginitomaculum sp.]
MRLENLINAAKANISGDDLPPVDQWNPENCANMQMRILRDGSWLHEGSVITRPALVKLFSTILRKDEDGQTWLVTPVEKVKVIVDVAHFIAVSVEKIIDENVESLYFTTNVEDVVKLDNQHSLMINTNSKTNTPEPVIRVRGRLDALLSRPVYYQLVEWAKEKDQQLGVFSDDSFFILGDKGEHLID